MENKCDVCGGSPAIVIGKWCKCRTCAPAAWADADKRIAAKDASHEAKFAAERRASESSEADRFRKNDNAGAM